MEKCPSQQPFWGEGGGENDPFKQMGMFFLQIRPHWLSTTKSSILMYLAGIERMTFVTAELRSNCSAIEQTDVQCRKMPIPTTFLGGGGENDPFKRWECFFLQIRPQWLLTTKSSILMYLAGIEPVTFVTAELRSNCSAIEQTDIHCGKMLINTTFFWREGGGRK